MDAGIHRSRLWTPPCYTGHPRRERLRACDSGWCCWLRSKSKTSWIDDVVNTSLRRRLLLLQPLKKGGRHVNTCHCCQSPCRTDTIMHPKHLPEHDKRRRLKRGRTNDRHLKSRCSPGVSEQWARLGGGLPIRPAAPISRPTASPPPSPARPALWGMTTSCCCCCAPQTPGAPLATTRPGTATLPTTTQQQQLPRRYTLPSSSRRLSHLHPPPRPFTQP